MISYLDFAQYLPTGAFDAPTPDQMLFNFATLHSSNPSDSLVHGLAEFLNALAKLNEERNASLPLDSEPLDFCVKSYVGTPSTPQLRYTLTFPINVEEFVQIVSDPTE
jgi:hypothetical protein